MELQGNPNGWHTQVVDPSIQAMGMRDSDDGLEDFNSLDPVPLAPDQLSPRMIAQRGMYTLHTFRRAALEELARQDECEYGAACFLHKVIIPQDVKADLRKELSIVAGVSEEYLFPDLEGFARDFMCESWERTSW